MGNYSLIIPVNLFYLELCAILGHLDFFFLLANNTKICIILALSGVKVNIRFLFLPFDVVMCRL